MGCVGGMSDSNDLSFAADPVRITDSAVTDSPFTIEAERTIQFNQSVAVGGEEQTVDLRVGMVQAQQSGDTPVPAHLIVLSVPEVDVLGTSVSVAEQFDPLSLLERSGGIQGEVEQGRKVDERQVRILGANRTVSVYRGSKSRAGSNASVLIYESSFQHSEDTIIILVLSRLG